MASKIFLAITILNAIVLFFQGRLEIEEFRIIGNIFVIFVCIVSVFIFERAQVKMWLKYVIVLVILLVVSTLLVSVMALLSGEPPTLYAYIESIILFVIIFSIAYTIARIAERKEKRSAEKNAEQDG